ncbi:MAG: hypothetical protein V7K47_06240 [Nostoc sp.]
MRNPRSVGGMGGKGSMEPEERKAGMGGWGRWGRNLSPHTSPSSHTPYTLHTLVRNPGYGWLDCVWEYGKPPCVRLSSLKATS